MKKIIILWFSILFLIAVSLSVNAWTNCTPDPCSAGYTNYSIYCIGGSCYRNCTGLDCSGSWTQVYSDQMEFQDNDNQGDDSSGSYSSSNTSLCYKFEFSASSDDINMKVVDEDYDPPGDVDNCDCEAFAGFKASGTNPWYENLTDSGDWGDNYWDDVNYSTFDYFFVAKRGHSNTEIDEDYTEEPYNTPMQADYSIYCAPTAEGCDAVANHSIDCDITCYGKSTYVYIYQASIEDYTSGDPWVNNNLNLWSKGTCTSSNVDTNYYRYPDYKVHTMPTTLINNDPSCERTNEAPTASNINIIPSSPTAGDDLTCNYTYSDPEDFEEKDSTYDWKKNGVSQDIDSRTLGKGNLSVNDKWSCEITPSDGLLNGNLTESSNATILSTVQSPKMYVEGTLAWSSSGYYSETEFITGFVDELNSALDSCTEDAQGYCNITLTFGSDTSGKMNLSELGIYHELKKAFTFRDNTSSNVAFFDVDGNLILAGNCTSQASCSGGSGAFLFKDSGGNEVAHVDNEGNLCIETGDCSDNSPSCNPSNSAFIFQDSQANNLSYIDLTNGDLCLTGDLTEYGNP